MSTRFGQWGGREGRPPGSFMSVGFPSTRSRSHRLPGLCPPADGPGPARVCAPGPKAGDNDMGKKGARLTPGILRRLTARSLSGLPAPAVLAALRLLSMANSGVESSCSGCDGWPDSFLACKRAGLGLQWSDQATAIGLVWFGDRRARGFGLALRIRRVCWSATGRGRGRWTCVLYWCCCESRDGKTMDSGHALLRKVRAPQTPESSAQRTADKRQAWVRILGQGVKPVGNRDGATQSFGTRSQAVERLSRYFYSGFVAATEFWISCIFWRAVVQVECGKP